MVSRVLTGLLDGIKDGKGHKAGRLLKAVNRSQLSVIGLRGSNKTTAQSLNTGTTGNSGTDF